MELSAPLYRLKRQARDAARATGAPLHETLNAVAAAEGYRSWDHLASKHRSGPAQAVLAQLKPGELVLLAARPGHGKTLLAVECCLRAAQIGRAAWIFSLDYTRADIEQRVADVAGPDTALPPNLHIDVSDDISAPYIIEAFAKGPEGALIAVDYLQLLDQRRSHPPLADQVAALKRFAQSRGATILLVSQIDRAFDGAERHMPGPDDLRLPNPIDRTLIDRWVFLHDGDISTHPSGARRED